MTRSESTDEPQFRTSSFSGGGNCVAVGRVGHDAIGVRTSRATDDSSVIVFSESEWAAFVQGVKAGEFDSP